MKKIKKLCSNVLKTRQKFGWLAAAQTFIDCFASKLCSLSVTQVVWLDVSDLGKLESEDSRFEFRFLSAEEIRDYSEDATLDLTEDLASRIETGDDLCFAALEQGKLAAYGWYALQCIEPEHNFNIAMSYSEKTAYMYKGFTHPDYRGLRLHGKVMGLALRSLQDRGVSSLVSTVGWTNFASLRSCDRLGYERLGNIYAIGSKSEAILRTPKKARQKEVRFGKAAIKRRRVEAAKKNREEEKVA